MIYETIFDISNKSLGQILLDNWMPLVIPLVLFSAGIISFFLHKKNRKIFHFAYIGFTLFLMISAYYSLFNEYFNLKNALISGKCKVVEGIITDFKPMPYNGHQQEEITVQGVTFNFSDFSMTSSYRNTVSHGGLLKSGVKVRIYYSNPSKIAKVEIAK
ncbi:MAG: hypothetical protein CVV21_02980 [Candidatus Goldiibacteriota bacterium HGW-Goldbacteria-1]|jgi:hypothetical protein|nr:MAG: hypothetical protein CVV21_02980 [Candidatus Goldiibacteriota bacterium HGW-Goldbacteria-1]